MRNTTRIKYNDFTKQVAAFNGVTSAAEKFSVDPTTQQKLETRLQESSTFLGMINMVGVPEQTGEKLGLGINSTIAGRTDTNTKDRQATDPSALQKISYACKQTNFDTALRYNKLDMWAKFPDFATRIRDALLVRQALDRIMIGFHGTNAATETDRDANPLLQDVNIGWIHKVRTDAPEQVISEGVQASGEILIHKNDGTNEGDFANLDALVANLVAEGLPAWYQDDTDLVVIMGRDLLNDKMLPMIEEHAEKPSETAALDVIRARKMVGGLPAIRVPYFPAGSLMITRLDNLSIYWQEGARRRAIIDNPKRDQIENYESSNDAYVIEDYEGVVIAENIKFAGRAIVAG
ncbi:phage major capsid protein, P2 family [Motilimonas sp. 1_MG-2023]|uniref:phage major capsid protein, P2 family n=1 Tax=Motilimonas sp. 1_MG-2023 TaxID=3062672 RepID=UPI0026E23C89|nr:phage major capsid protein, P2 family [Motilimonas sp. 1_MG-2023]MDO6525449.1 phage major capsid protein, P2 family [Motilimonas sp. 1_MG-2023]